MPLGYNNSVNLQPNTSVLAIAIAVAVAVVNASASVSVIAPSSVPCSLHPQRIVHWLLWATLCFLHSPTAESQQCALTNALSLTRSLSLPLCYVLHFTLFYSAERHSHTTTYLTHTHSALSAFCVQLWPFFRAQLPPNECDRAAAESVVCVCLCWCLCCCCRCLSRRCCTNSQLGFHIESRIFHFCKFLSRFSRVNDVMSHVCSEFGSLSVQLPGQISLPMLLL